VWPVYLEELAATESSNPYLAREPGMAKAQQKLLAHSSLEKEEYR